MDFKQMMQTDQVIIKLSVSNVLAAQAFYTEILGFTVDQGYTINAGGNYGMESYVQLQHEGLKGVVALGLFKDIEQPMAPQETGTAATFIVKDIVSTRDFLIAQGVEVGGIIENTSDHGLIDHFAFFADPDNNTLVIRQNMN